MREGRQKKVDTSKLSKVKKSGLGGPTFIGKTIGDKSPSFASVGRDGVNLVKDIGSGLGSAASAIGSVAGKVGNVIKSTVHNDAFPTKQRQIYLKKKADDEWKSSDVRKKLLELNKNR